MVFVGMTGLHSSENTADFVDIGLLSVPLLCHSSDAVCGKGRNH